MTEHKLSDTIPIDHTQMSVELEKLNAIDNNYDVIMRDETNVRSSLIIPTHYQITYKGKVIYEVDYNRTIELRHYVYAYLMGIYNAMKIYKK